MKKQLKTLLLVALFAGTAIPVWSQASTEGKEFWVALNMTTGTGGTDHEPFIYITTQHQGGSYTITNPADPTFTPISGLIPPTGYIKIKASTVPASGEIDLNKWYPVGQTAQAVSNQVKNTGLKITTTVDCSVFAGNRLPQSFDAANILPITALQMDYITQDYPGYDHENKGGGYPVTTILATENNTQVTILPTSAVLNSNGTATIIKNLNAGQVLYLTGDNRAALSGSTITSDKKIAVFTGVNNTDVPGPVSARDHLYEQNMPVDYWGTHFVVTRSMKKDANRIRVTASNNGTELIVDGISLATINAGETYEFELCESVMRTEEGYTKAAAEGRGCEYYLDGEAHYLETSCPCAVFSYDVSENYYIKKNGTSERDPNSAGDPAMVWISPLEQQLRKVTFGVMNTDQTPTHYVNIITPTSGAGSLEVREIAMSAGQVVYGNNLVQPTDVKPVPGKPEYSYARIKLTENAESVYTITSGVGFIAHVYGSGNKESYAYSCGSAAVQQGVNINGETFTDGYQSDTKFCLNTELSFDAKVGTDEISRVDWNFGDGTTANYGTPQITHEYTSPGWYDVTAALYGHQVCTTEDEMELGTIHFSFRVVRPDTLVKVPEHHCFDLDGKLDGQGTTYTEAEIEEMIANGGTTYEQEDCSSTYYIIPVSYGRETVEELDTIEGRDQATGYNGITYYTSTDVIDTITPPAQSKKCTIYRKYHVRVITCVDLQIINDSTRQHICPKENLVVEYAKTKGDIKSVRFVVPGLVNDTVTGVISNTLIGKLELPTAAITKPGKYKAQLIVEDVYCDTKTYTIDLAVYYPENIIKYKFNNVMAVYNSGFGGNDGYEFKGYQWYVNYQLVEGADGPTLYLGDDVQFEIGDVVYVVLTDLSGMALPSCPYSITKVPDYDKPDYNSTPARKVLQENRFVIIKEGNAYDIYGQKVK